MGTYKVDHYYHGEVIVSAETEVHAAYRAAKVWDESFRHVMRKAEITEIKKEAAASD